MSKYLHIFKPLKIGRVTVKNRIELAPVGPFLATSDGYVSRELIEWGRQFARGGAGIVTLGNSSIVPPTGTPAGYAIHVGTDKSINPLNRFAEVIQRYGAKASIQLNYSNRCPPADMTLEEINMIVESFASAAERCLKAGMDMVMVHGAHGHLLSQFLSPRSNSRTDAYGGTFKNRARLAIAVLEAIRNRVGDRLAIEYRISADEFVPGGLTVEEQLEFARMIQDKIDLVHVSVGNLFAPETMPMMDQPTYIPRGINVKYAALFKKELKIPVAIVGSLNLEMAENIIAENKADMVAMARTLIADPDCVSKAAKGDEDKIRPCIRCNTCINRTHFLSLSVRCAVNPVIGREAESVSLPAAKRKKVVVIGGGPAGMEAARRAAERGHEVVLFEKGAQLGGSLAMASALPFKTDMRQYLDWGIRATMDTPNLTVKLSTEAATEGIKAEHPDVLIIAAGSVPIVPGVPGADRKNVVWAGDVILGKVKIGDRVVVAGAGLTGSETALYLAQQGKKITLIDMLPREEIDASAPFINIMTLRRMLSELNVDFRTEVKLGSVTGSGAVIIDKNGNRTEIPCDTVVFSLGVQPVPAILEGFKDIARDVFVVGDCHNQRGNLCSATTEGFFAAAEI